MNLSEKAELTLFQQWAIKYTDKNKIYMSLVQVSTIYKEGGSYSSISYNNI